MAEEFQQIVRILDSDIHGNIKIGHALTKVHGVSFMLSNAICNILSIDKNKKIGEIDSDVIKKITDLVKEGSEIPSWMLNRRKDRTTGKDMHLVSSDLKFNKDSDIKFLRKIRSYRGSRHALGLPSRGQRTRSNFRKGKTVGVKKRGAKK